MLLFEGPAGSGRLAAAHALCTAAGIALLVAHIDAAMHAQDPFDEVVGLCVREATLRNAAIYWEGCEVVLEPGRPRLHWDQLVEAVESFPGPAVLATTVPRDPLHQLRTRLLVRYAPRPAYELRRRLWDRCRLCCMRRGRAGWCRLAA